MLKRHIGIVSIILVLLLSSCMIFQSPAEITVKDEEGNAYIVKITVNGKESYVKDGKILINLSDGVYTARIPGMRVFKDTYELTVKDGKGTIVLERSNTVGANVLMKTNGEKILIVSGMDGYRGFEVKFAVDRLNAGNTFSGDGRIMTISSPKAFAMITMNENEKLSDWIVVKARSEWKDVEGIRVFDGETVETVF